MTRQEVSGWKYDISQPDTQEMRKKKEKFPKKKKVKIRVQIGPFIGLSDYLMTFDLAWFSLSWHESIARDLNCSRG